MYENKISLQELDIAFLAAKKSRVPNKSIKRGFEAVTP